MLSLKININIYNNRNRHKTEFLLQNMNNTQKPIHATSRFAIYFAPEINSKLHLLGSQWLGRDVNSGKLIKQPEIQNITSEYFYKITKNPSLYGFHATLKAPFHLNIKYTLNDLQDHIKRLCASMQPFNMYLTVKQVGQFLALVMDPKEKKMVKLASDLVKQVDHFRAPLQQSTIDKRRLSVLTRSQDSNLLKWGYPYVLSDFRFHMTLTEKITLPSARQQLENAASLHFAPSLNDIIKVNNISLFYQKTIGADFYQIQRFQLGK